MAEQRVESPAPSIDTIELEFPNGKTYRFGSPSFSRQLARFISLSREMAKVGDDTEPDPDKMFEVIEMSWHLAHQSLVNGGHSQEEADAALESIPFNDEWLEKIKTAIGLG